MTTTRGQIRTHVQSNAGIHFNELVRESEFAPGQIQYHVRRLIDSGDLVRGEFYGRTHYYPPTYDEWERAALALFRRETTRELVVYLIEHEPAEPAAVAAASISLAAPSSTTSSDSSSATSSTNPTTTAIRSRLRWQILNGPASYSRPSNPRSPTGS